MSDDIIHYSELIDGAMRSVVREVLRRVAKTGLPGEHHFYITFRTDHPQARVSETLRARYPQEMTIVLQHQFWDFKVEDTQFGVTLSFGGVPEKLVIPYAALTGFADPSVKFGLQFHVESDDDDGMPDQPFFDDEMVESEEKPEASTAAEIISLDAFRKK